VMDIPAGNRSAISFLNRINGTWALTAWTEENSKHIVWGWAEIHFEVIVLIIRYKDNEDCWLRIAGMMHACQGVGYVRKRHTFQAPVVAIVSFDARIGSQNGLLLRLCRFQILAVEDDDCTHSQGCPFILNKSLIREKVCERLITKSITTAGGWWDWRGDKTSDRLDAAAK
jgi:hypothetical protein